MISNKDIDDFIEKKAKINYIFIFLFLLLIN